MKEEGGIRDVRRQRERKQWKLISKERETRDGEQKERTIWMHRSRASYMAVDGVAWLVGTVALAFLMSAGQHIVEVLTEPYTHTQEKNACQDNV